MPKKNSNKDRRRQVKRFLSYCKPVESGCVEWQGHRDKKGYGRFRSTILPTQAGMVKAHRLSYRIFRGEIPEDMEVDHICLNTCCVRHDHLQLMTKSENTAKGNRDRGIDKG